MGALSAPSCESCCSTPPPHYNSHGSTSASRPPRFPLPCQQHPASAMTRRQRVYTRKNTKMAYPRGGASGPTDRRRSERTDRRSEYKSATKRVGRKPDCRPNARSAASQSGHDGTVIPIKYTLKQDRRGSDSSGQRASEQTIPPKRESRARRAHMHTDQGVGRSLPAHRVATRATGDRRARAQGSRQRSGASW